MPETTLTGYKRRIREYADEHHHFLTDSKVSRLATRLHKRQARMWDEDLERIFTHPDPTPAQAIRNIEREGAQQS